MNRNSDFLYRRQPSSSIYVALYISKLLYNFMLFMPFNNLVNMSIALILKVNRKRNLRHDKLNDFPDIYDFILQSHESAGKYDAANLLLYLLFIINFL